jgi:hypothetical protein
MRDIPSAADLLSIARSTLLDDVLPRLPADLRYTALMIANAIAIAGRAIEVGDTSAQAELARLSALLGEPNPPATGDRLRIALTSANRRLADSIRAGEFDGERRAALLEHLHAACSDKLAISNPKALDR